MPSRLFPATAFRQDTDSAAQIALEPEVAEHEVQSVLMGGGMVAGPVGVVVGTTLGASAGALGGAAVGAMANPEDAFWYLASSNIGFRR